MRKGFFVTFEGGEGAGKSIQVQILASYLREEGYKVTVTREPGGTRIGEQIRSITHSQENVDLDSKAEAYLMAAARAQHVAEVISPSIDAGRIVISDRFVDSSIVYQGYGRKLGAEFISKLNEVAVNGAVPDVTVLLDIPFEIGMKRRHDSKKSTDRLDLQQQDFYERVYKGYQTLARTNADRYVIIDAKQSVEQVATEIRNIVSKKIKKHFNNG